MTEYDYSPQAREQYMAKQRHISNWTHQTANAKQANPFLPTPSEFDTAERSQFYSSSSSHSSPRAGTPHHARYTSPERAGDHYHHSHSRPPHSSSTTTTSRSRSLSHAPSSSSASTATYHPRPYTPPHPTATLPVRSHSHPGGITSYEIDPRADQVILPPPTRGETYIIIPPDGRQVNVVSHDSQSTIPTHYHHPPARKPSPPLIKRVFSSHTHTTNPTASSSHRTHTSTRSASYPPSAVRGYPDSHSSASRRSVESGGKSRRSRGRHDSY